MIKRLSTAAIGVALVFSATAAQAGPYYGYDGRNFGEPPALNWGRPEVKNVKRVKDDPEAPASASLSPCTTCSTRSRRGSDR